MIYAYDLGVQLPISSIYDTQMMLAQVAAAKDMYEKAALEMKDFKKEYGDFYSPIQNDMTYYAQNVTGRILNKLNDLYARGMDPLRNPEARAEIRQEINKINPGEIALLKQSAENATEFLKAQRQLQLQGLYNPLYAQYDGPSLNNYSTLGENGQGIWTKMSPTPIKDIAAFGNPYFEGMKPNVHRTSKNGIEYSEESITMDDLRRIANSRFNDLVNTPQGQLMYKYFKDVTGDDLKAREMFNETVAEGQNRRIYTRDDYEDNFFKQQSLNLQRASYDLQRLKFNYLIRKDIENQLNGWTLRVQDDRNYKLNLIDIDKIPKTAKDYMTLYSMLQYRMSGDDAKGALAVLSGSNEKLPIFIGSNVKGYPMTFGGMYDNLHLTYASEQNFLESNFKIKRSVAVDDFNDFLRTHGIHGYVTDNKASALYDDNGGYDISFKMLVKESDLNGYFNNKSQGYKNKLLNLIGATTQAGVKRKPGKDFTLKWGEETYIELPVTGTLNGPRNEIDASVANAVKRGSKYVNEYEQNETE